MLHSERKYLRPLTLPTSRSPETPICHLYERRRRRRRRHLLILSSVSHIPSSLNICKFRSPRCCSFLPSPSLPLLTSTSTVQSVPSVFITLLTQIKGVTGGRQECRGTQSTRLRCTRNAGQTRIQQAISAKFGQFGFLFEGFTQLRVSDILTLPTATVCLKVSLILSLSRQARRSS